MLLHGLHTTATNDCHNDSFSKISYVKLTPACSKQKSGEKAAEHSS
jgi:hypothetical protein